MISRLVLLQQARDRAKHRRGGGIVAAGLCRVAPADHGKMANKAAGHPPRGHGSGPCPAHDLLPSTNSVASTNVQVFAINPLAYSCQLTNASSCSCSLRSRSHWRNRTHDVSSGTASMQTLILGLRWKKRQLFLCGGSKFLCRISRKNKLQFPASGPSSHP